jgi:hypothetical protein
VKITMVQKRLPDGSICPKCREVRKLLEDRGLHDRIHRFLEASPKDPEGEGMQLVRKHQMKKAPFFIVETEDGSVAVYDSVLRMLRDLFSDKDSGG